MPAPHDGTDIRIDGASDISILGNRIAYADAGIRFRWTAAAGVTQIHGNTFEHLRCGVCLTNAISAYLGDLGNPSTDDDGGNEFALTNTVHILNRNTSRVPAEGNSFGTTMASEIDAKILDQLDWPAYGRVDFDPLQGGVSPSGHGSAHGLALRGAAAVATTAGAEVVYTLSAPSAVTVTISNLTGRPIATVIEDRPSGEGLQRVVWNGQSASGTRAPNGRYLVCIEARSGSGEQAQAITPLVMVR